MQLSPFSSVNELNAIKYTNVEFIEGHKKYPGLNHKSGAQLRSPRVFLRHSEVPENPAAQAVLLEWGLGMDGPCEDEMR